MNWILALGYAGSIISGGAYVPQIIHLLRERCTAGLSKRAFSLWLVSSVLILINAVVIASPVFILLSSVQTLATAIILLFTFVYNGHVCGFHADHTLTGGQDAAEQFNQAK